MPDKNKLALFARTGMTIFKTCSICRYGEIPGGSWGLCKNPGHFFDHLKHGRHAGVSHASMGCDDFEMINENSKYGAQLGLYAKLVPVFSIETEDVGMDDGAEDEDFAEACILTDSAVADANEDEP